MTIKINAKRLERMKKPVDKISKLYGPAQLAQYMVAKLLAENSVNSMMEIHNFVETVAQATISDLSDYLQDKTAETTKNQSRVIEIEQKQPRKKLF